MTSKNLKPGFRTPHKFTERKKLGDERRKAAFSEPRQRRAMLRPRKLTRLPFTRRGI